LPKILGRDFEVKKPGSGGVERIIKAIKEGLMKRTQTYQIQYMTYSMSDFGKLCTHGAWPEELEKKI
jgi:hypothetical protein